MSNQIDPPEIIPTGRLILRRAGLSDAVAIFHQYAQDKTVALYMTWRPHAKLAETEEFLRGCIKRWENGTEYNWVITVAGDDSAIGMISVRISGHAADIGYVLARRLWNAGFMTEAMTAIISWLEQQPGIYRIWASHDVDNPASGRVMEKSGLIREGIFRRWAIHPNLSIAPRDAVIYAKIRDER